MKPNVTIIGKQNVGKSTIFNKMTRRDNTVLVSNTPGLTRDRQYGSVKWKGYEFTIVDTGGLVKKKAYRNICN